VRRLATENRQAWYHMLETLRQYGAERLAAAGHECALRVRHRDHYRLLAAQFEAEGFGPDQAQWFLRLRRESGNLRTALEFCLSEPGEAAAAFDIAAPIWNFWFAGFLREGYRYLTRALELAPEQTPERAYALWAASYLAMFATDLDSNAAMLAECTAIASRLHDPRLHARIRECRGHARLYQDDLVGAIELLDLARHEYQALEDPLGEFDTLILLTACTFFLDDPRADEYSQQALLLAEQAGAQSSTAYALWAVGISLWREGHFDEATRSLRSSVRLFLPMHDLTGISFGVQALSWCAAFAEPGERAARLLGAAQAVWRTSGARTDETTAYTVFDQRSAEALRAAAGAGVMESMTFERAFAEGAAYSFDQAVALALGELDDPGDPGDRGDPGDPGDQTIEAPARRRAAPGGLTRRELEVAGLLADGLSNKEIAARLLIAQRTVETHVDHVLAKLGLTSRGQVASWVAAQGEAPRTT